MKGYYGPATPAAEIAAENQKLANLLRGIVIARRLQRSALGVVRMVENAKLPDRGELREAWSNYHRASERLEALLDEAEADIPPRS